MVIPALSKCRAKKRNLFDKISKILQVMSLFYQCGCSASSAPKDRPDQRKGGSFGGPLLAVPLYWDRLCSELPYMMEKSPG